MIIGELQQTKDLKPSDQLKRFNKLAQHYDTHRKIEQEVKAPQIVSFTRYPIPEHYQRMEGTYNTVEVKRATNKSFKKQQQLQKDIKFEKAHNGFVRKIVGNLMKENQQQQQLLKKRKVNYLTMKADPMRALPIVQKKLQKNSVRRKPTLSLRLKHKSSELSGFTQKQKGSLRTQSQFTSIESPKIIKKQASAGSILESVYNKKTTRLKNPEEVDTFLKTRQSFSTKRFSIQPDSAQKNRKSLSSLDHVTYPQRAKEIVEAVKEVQAFQKQKQSMFTLKIDNEINSFQNILSGQIEKIRSLSHR